MKTQIKHVCLQLALCIVACLTQSKETSANNINEITEPINCITGAAVTNLTINGDTEELTCRTRIIGKNIYAINQLSDLGVWTARLSTVQNGKLVDKYVLENKYFSTATLLRENNYVLSVTTETPQVGLPHASYVNAYLLSTGQKWKLRKCLDVTLDATTKLVDLQVKRPTILGLHVKTTPDSYTEPTEETVLIKIKDCK